MADLEEPDAEEFGQLDGVNGPDHARQLFAAVEAGGLLDYRGCEACPAACLCPRSQEHRGSEEP
ncbi:hypothetical protein JK364_50515 [Streptomyces sp. 110]|uniref:Uncharacterized protein n=1 Tax=Streptomyces endocoffeicus TaxID=2898945 RepID=A0ABS1Q724_9ACTN|nr:hypothetical protein [Streptomyces endocoffeicus]MBL1120473.1 hypothetical protein [Streptomyces endocoffeicus]